MKKFFGASETGKQGMLSGETQPSGEMLGWSADDRISELETSIADLRRDIAAIRIELSAISSRHNATISLYEQRVDQIYRRIVQEFSKVRGVEGVAVESEAAVDGKIIEIYSAGLEAPVDLENLKLRNIVSGVITPGVIDGPLTLFGFRLNRRIARERGSHIYVAAGGESIAVYGPYKRLAPGNYTVSFGIERLEGDGGSGRYIGEIALDVFSQATQSVVVDRSVPINALVDRVAVELQWEAKHAGGTIEIRLHQRSNCAIRITDVSVMKQPA